MIQIDPQTIRTKASQDFLSDLLQSIGLPAQAVTSSPYSRKGKFSVAGGAAGEYFDIGNVALGAVAVGALPVKPVVYLGRLVLSIWQANFTIAGAYSAYLVNGVSGALQEAEIRSDLITGAAASGIILSTNIYQEDAVFEFIRLQVGGAGNVMQIEYQFDGIRILY